MSLDILYQQKLFEEYQSGRTASFNQVLEEERPYLFDYLLRMTGDVQRSLLSIASVFEKTMPAEKQWQNLSQLRFHLYEQCRRFNSGFWNADVKRLQNQHLVAILSNPQSPEDDKRRANAFFRLDRGIASFPPEQREVMILHLRAKFTFSEIARIMSKKRDDVEATYGNSMRLLQERLGKLASDPRTAISKLIPHPLPQTAPTQITDLREIMGGVRRVQGQIVKTSLSIVVISLLAFGIVGLGLLLWEPRTLPLLINSLKKIQYFFGEILGRR